MGTGDFSITSYDVPSIMGRISFHLSLDEIATVKYLIHHIGGFLYTQLEKEQRLM